MKKSIFLLTMMLAVLAAQAIDTRYKDAALPVDKRVEILLSQMTLEEKVGQLQCPLGWPMWERKGNAVVPSAMFVERMSSQPMGALWATLRADPWTQKTLDNGLHPRESQATINMLQRYAVEHTRLGIPMFIAEECPHGHMAIGTTVFPTGIGQASTFNPELIERMGRTIGDEIAAQGVHVAYGPVVDLAREPRWSRVEETLGEDTYLSSTLGAAFVRGVQSSGVIATMKHFVAYGIPVGGLNGEAASIGMNALFNEHMPIFKAAVDAGIGSIMTSYNSIDGEPTSSSSFLLRDILRGAWEYKGLVFSDLHSIEGVATTHRCAASIEDAAVMALKAGVDIDLEGNAYRHLVNAYNGGKITDSDLNAAVARVLRKKFEMGLFDKPYVSASTESVHSDIHRQTALQVAREGIVLLKNDGVLPLSGDVKRIAVIGPNADVPYNQLGDYTAPQPREAVSTVLDGIKSRVAPSTQVVYEKGCAVRDTSTAGIYRAVEAARSADVTVLVVGGSSARDFKTDYMDTGAARVNDNSVADMECGEGYDRQSLDLMGSQTRLMQALVDAGVKLVVVYIEGRPLNKNLAHDKANALLTAWYPGEQGGAAVADVIMGNYNPAGRLPVSVPRNVGQLPVYYTKHPSHDYIEGTEQPLYPFGYGLSYSAFVYSDITVQGRTVSCRVTNTSSRDGDEVVQLYVRDDVSSIVTPHKQLKAFERVHIKAGETKVVTFALTDEMLAIYDTRGGSRVEPGTFTLMIGPDSSTLLLQAKYSYPGGDF